MDQQASALDVTQEVMAEARTLGGPGNQPRDISKDLEVLTACSSSVVIDIGITGSSAGFSDPDAFVDAYDATGAAYAPRDVADAAPVLTCKVADTIDALMAGAASTAGKIRVFAILCDVSGIDETDRNTDAQHDTAV